MHNISEPESTLETIYISKLIEQGEMPKVTKLVNDILCSLKINTLEYSCILAVKEKSRMLWHYVHCIRNAKYSFA